MCPQIPCDSLLIVLLISSYLLINGVCYLSNLFVDNLGGVLTFTSMLFSV